MKLIEMIKNNKKLEVLLYASLVVIAVVVYLFASGKKNNGIQPLSTGTNSQSAHVITEAETERRLEETLSKIRGAGKVCVMITYDTSGEIVPALSTTEQENNAHETASKSNSEKPATVVSEGDESPIVLTEIQPKVRGVIVIAQGACDIDVRLNLEYAVSAVLGIDQSCIEVFEMGTVNIDSKE